MQSYNSPKITTSNSQSGSTPSYIPSPIVSHGKLPYSSYYDVVTNATIDDTDQNTNPTIINTTSTTTTTTNATNPETIEQQQQQQQHPVIYNNNLEIWSCVFSPDGSHLAWSCGYGLIKLMKWTDSSTRKRTTSNEMNSPPKNMRPEESMTTPASMRNELYDMYQQSSKSSDTTTTTPIRTTQHQDQSSNISAFAVRNMDKIIEIDCGEMVWSLAFGSPTSFVKHQRNLHFKKSGVYNRFKLSEHRLILAVGLASGKIRIYDGTTGRFLLVLFDHKDTVRDLKFTQDGSLQLASVSRDETIKLWNMLDDGNMYRTLQGHVSWVYACDWSPTACLLASVGVNRQAFIWDTQTYEIKHKLQGHLHDVVTCQFSPDGSLLATGSYDTKIILWDPYTGRMIKQFYHMLPPPRFIYACGANGSFVRSLAFSSNGDHLVSICDDKKLRIWSLCKRSLHPIAEGTHSDGICCAYSTDSRAIMVGTRNGFVDVYEAPFLIQRLVDICRKVVNQTVDRESVMKLKVPSELKKFLLYEDLVEGPFNSNQTTPLNGKSSSSSNSTINTNSTSTNGTNLINSFQANLLRTP